MTTPASVYDAAGGDPGLRRLAQAWHERVLADPVVSHAFQHGYHPDHTDRLAAYWGEALGGPPRYTQTIASESAVVALHSGEGDHAEMDERAIACFATALSDAGLDAEPLRSTLLAYFTWATHELARYPESADDVPEGLPLPRWSWGGPVATGAGSG
jgi:hemoglobin